MNFIAPLWFLLGAAAAVPLLVHLLRRRSGATTEFPATRYLLRAEREHSRAIRLRNLLLMLLRVLAVLLLAVAAARPLGRLLAPAAAAGHAPTALAIVLDNSLSTSVIEDGRPALEPLRDAARALVEAATDQDRIYLVTADGQVRAGSRQSALAAIGTITPLAGAGDLPGAVRRASGVVAGMGNIASHVVVLTDGQRTTWDTPFDLPEGASVTLLVPGTPAPANRGVIAASPRPERWTPSGALDVRIHAQDSTPIRVLLGARGRELRTVARAVAPPGAVIAVRASPVDTGWLAGRVEMDGDEMPGDDVRYYAVWVGPAPRVRVLPGAGPFAQSAVDAVRSTGALQAGDDVRILSADELGPGHGAVLVVPPGAPALHGAANAALGRAGIPWRFGAQGGPGTVRGDDVQFTAHRSYALTPVGVPETDTLLTVNDRLWAVAGAANGTRYVVIASPLLPEATDLPVRAVFVPWLASLVTNHLAGTGGVVMHAAPAQVFRRPASADALVKPDGTTIPLADEQDAAPAEPGVYFLARQGTTTGALVVNVEEIESVLDRLQSTEVAARIRGPQVGSVSSRESLVRAAFAAGGTRTLVGPVLLLALLVLGAEAFVTTFRARGTA